MNSGLLYDTFTERMLCKLGILLRKYRFVILGSFVSALLAYTFAFTNKLINLDDVYYLFEKGATVESGRWGLLLLSQILPDYSMPWLYGILSVAILTASICLCVRMLGISNPVLQSLLAGIIITFPSQATVFAYMFAASSYAIACLLAVAAAYLLCCCGKKAWLLALLSLVFSVSIYQAYVSITATLLVLYLIKCTLSGEICEKMLFRKGVFFVCFLVLSLGSYWIITNMIWKLTGTTMGGYANSALSFGADKILQRMKDAYIAFYGMLRYGHFSLIVNTLSHAVHAVCLVIVCTEIVLWILGNKQVWRRLLLVFLLGVLPLSINCIYLLVEKTSIHSLAMYAFAAVYLLTAIVLENCKDCVLRIKGCTALRAIGCNLVIWGMAVLVVCNISFANKAFLNLHLQYENTYSFTTSVVTSLQNTPGFTTDSTVALVGLYPEAEYQKKYFSFLDGILGFEEASPGMYSIPLVFEYYNGVALNFATVAEVYQIQETAEFLQMQSYPNYGSIQVINDIFVVKLSDTVKEIGE